MYIKNRSTISLKVALTAKYTSIYQGVNPYRICQDYCDNPQNVEIFLQKSKVFVDNRHM